MKRAPPPEAIGGPHEVGRNAEFFDPLAGRLMKAGSQLVFPSIHMHANNEDTTAHLRVAYKFHPKGYKPQRARLGPDVRQRRDRSSSHAGRPAGPPVRDPAAAHEAHDLRAAHARVGRENVSRGDLGRPSRNADLRRLRSQLGQGLQVRGRCRAAPAERHAPPRHGVFRHDAETTRTSSTRGTGRGSAIDRSTTWRF